MVESSNTKKRILDAAGRVVLAHGPGELTLEAVAEAAGLSKGGLLYHFASKEALLSAMVERLIAVTEQRIDVHRQYDREAGSWTRGYVRACAADDAADSDPTARLGVAVLAAGALEPGLMQRLHERQPAWRAAMHNNGIDPTTAQIVRLAADGLWLNAVFGLPVPEGTERADVLARLETMTRP